VDFATRRRILDRFQLLDQDPATVWADQARGLLASLEDGGAKLFVTWRALNCRLRHPDLFLDGDYLPLAAEGPLAGHLCAFARRWGGELAVAVAPRLFKTLQQEGGGEVGAAWRGNRVEVPAAGDYVNVLTGESHGAEPDGTRYWLSLEPVLGSFPVALLLLRGGNPGPKPRTQTLLLWSPPWNLPKPTFPSWSGTAPCRPSPPACGPRTCASSGTG
jgi:(1->4)-alpha-D-glucan 1-alpha-D-glucosylmutase